MKHGFLLANSKLDLCQERVLPSYPDETWLFIGKFKIGPVPGKSVALVVASKKVSKSVMSMMQGHLQSNNCY